MAQGFTLRDLLAESLEGVGARPSRLIITLLGTVLGIASLVATMGLAQTTAGQIAKSFDLLQATRVTVEPGTAEGRSGTERVTVALPWNSVERVEGLVGVQTAALYAEVSPTPEVAAVQVVDPAEAAVAPPPVVAASPELLDVVAGTLTTGRFFDTGHNARGDRVVVLELLDGQPLVDEAHLGRPERELVPNRGKPRDPAREREAVECKHRESRPRRAHRGVGIRQWHRFSV